MATWITQKTITVGGFAGPNQAYLRVLYHLYEQFKTGGTWQNYAEVVAVSDVAHFASETDVISGDWLVIQFTTKVNNETVQIFFGGKSSGTTIGPYTTATNGLLCAMGFTGGWADAIGFAKDTQPILLGNDTTEVWKLHMSITTDAAALMIFGSMNNSSTPDAYDIAGYFGEYTAFDSTDHYKTVMIVGDPQTGQDWTSTATAKARTFSEFEDAVMECTAVYITDATLLGKDATHLARTVDICVLKSTVNVGTIGTLLNLFQVKNSGVTDASTDTYGTDTYIKSKSLLYIYN